MKSHSLNRVAYVLVIIGGLNWGLIGFFNFNLVDSIFGDSSALSRVIYALVGVSAVYLAVVASHAMGGNKHSDRTAHGTA